MASADPSELSDASSEASTASLPPPTLREKAMAKARELILANKRNCSTLPSFDYMPFFLAIAERSVTWDFENLEELLAQNAAADGGQAEAPHCHQGTAAINASAAAGRPPKQPGDGCWDHVWYVPTWTDPDWDPNWEVLITGEKQQLNQRDALNLRRPALRAADLLRNPTDYAKRFGAWPDRPDGRSRCSPSTSTTRGNAAYQVQLDLIPDRQRGALVAETQRRIREGVSRWDLRVGPVDQGVIDDWMTQQSFPTLNGMRMAAVEKGTSYEQLVETLPSTVRTLYQPMMDEILADQDVQRIIFCNMTTDELVASKIHTMSNDEKSDLTGPLHPLLERNMWEDTLWRGTVAKRPRFLYNLQGKRMEWDVHRNDELWTAMQPAMQMASRVLTSKPRFWTSLKDLGTRMTVPNGQDPRTAEEEAGSNLAWLIRFAPLHEKDDITWPDAIEKLQKLGFDFEGWTDHFLMEFVEIGLSCATFDEEGDQMDPVYGYTWMTPSYRQSKPRIHVTIAADIVWPLLVGEYSSSEKLCNSLLFATTLLHELMHATHMAQVVMLNGDAFLFPPGQSRETLKLLREVSDGMFDRDTFQEPYWRNHPFTELGYAFEEDWYGMAVNIMTDMSVNKVRRFQPAHVPIIAGARSFPSACSNQDGRSKSLKAPMPSQRWGVGLPVEYYASFFMESWWNATFFRYGQVAFRHLPPERTHYGLRVADIFPLKTLYAIMGGEEQYRFFNLVISLLAHSGLNIVSRYLHESVRDLCRAEALRASWERAENYWAVEEEDFVRMMLQLSNMAEQADVHRDAWQSPGPDPNFLDQQYQEYVEKVPSLQFGSVVIMTKEEFLAAKQREIMLSYAWGGRVQRSVMEVNTHVRARVAVFQHLVFDFLTLSNTDRCRVFHDQNSSGDVTDILGRLRARIERYIVPVEKAGMWCEGTAARVPGQLFEQWASYYSQHYKMLVQLQDILLHHHIILDGQAQRVRRTFQTVPSGLDKKTSTRLRSLAIKEYVLLDSRIRTAVDEVASRLRILGQVDLFPSPSDMDQLSRQMARLATNPDGLVVQQQQQQQQAQGPFAWQRPDVAPMAQPLPLQPETQPVRATDPATLTATNPATDPATAQPPAPARPDFVFVQPGRAPWTPAASAFQIPRVPAGQGFEQYAAAAPATSHYPLGAPAGFGSGFGFGGGAAAPLQAAGSTGSAEDGSRSVYERNGLGVGVYSMQPFAAPYADRTTVTNDLANVVPAAPSAVDFQALRARMWRERRPSSPSVDVDADGDVIMTT